MAGGGRRPHTLEGRSVQSSGILGPLPGAIRVLDHTSHHPDHLENKVAAQAAEIEKLVKDNRLLVAGNAALREDLITVQKEAQQLKAHIRSIQTESDIQIRVLMEKIAKRDAADIRAADSVKEDLKQALTEARNLVKDRPELIDKIRQASHELQMVRPEVKNFPDLQAELDDLRQEYNRLRDSFKYEKGFNIAKVEELQSMEKNLIEMARQVDTIYAEILNTEKRANAPGPYTQPLNGAGGSYVDPYGRTLGHQSSPAAADGMMSNGNCNEPGATSGQYDLSHGKS
ncbi:Protein FLX-like 2 [Linum perenne]